MHLPGTDHRNRLLSSSSVNGGRPDRQRPRFIHSVMRAACLALMLAASALPARAETIDDVSRLNATEVRRIDHPERLGSLQEALAHARDNGLKVSIAGARHSQGGHILYPDAVVLDMTGYDKVLALDLEHRTITVQSGATWAEIQDFLNPHGLAVAIQQSSNIFTVGGSLSTNIHGRDPRFGALIDGVRKLTLLTAQGTVLTLSRTENAELFSLVMGGYGLFGVILDAELDVVPNSLLEKSTVTMPCAAYPAYVRETVLPATDLELHYARPDVTQKAFLETCLVTDYRRIGDVPGQLTGLQSEKWVKTTKWLFDLSRRSESGKALRWHLQESFLDAPGKVQAISRNNAMRPPIRFLDYASETDTDILQEYFVPLWHAATFQQKMAHLLQRNNVNLLSMTLRVMRADATSFMPYAREDSIAFVLYINHARTQQAVDHARNWTRQLVDLTLAAEGTYYLPYALYPTRAQLVRSYPMIDRFFSLKTAHDPQHLFMNRFYAAYNHGT